MISSLFYPLLGPLMLILIFTLIGQAVTTRNEPLELPVAGGEHAPALVAFLKQQNVFVQPAPADPRAAVSAGDAAAVLVIPQAYGDAFRAGRPATVQLVIDNSRQSASITIDRARELLKGYSDQIGRLRLMARGVSPIAIQALAIEDVDVATSQSRAANLLNLCRTSSSLRSSPAARAGGRHHRRRARARLLGAIADQSRAPSQCSAGQTADSQLLTVVAVVETLLGFTLVLNLVPLGQAFGVQLSFSLASMITFFC